MEELLMKILEELRQMRRLQEQQADPGMANFADMKAEQLLARTRARRAEKKRT